MSDAGAIDYASGSRRDSWLRRNRRRVVALIVLSIVGAVGWRSRVGIVRYVEWQYWHWRLSRFEAAQASTGQVCEPLNKLQAIDPLIDALLNANPSVSGRAKQTYDFVGQRLRPDGTPRTVVIRLQPEMYQPFNGALVAVLARPSVFALPPQATGFHLVGYARSGRWVGANVSARPDSADPSRFHLSLQPWGMFGVDYSKCRPTELTGCLTNDDTIAWTIESHGEEFPAPRAPVPFARNEAWFRAGEALSNEFRAAAASR